MSYVFSKALNVSPEERERRKTLPPKWSTPNVPHLKVAPPVAAKPKTNTDASSFERRVSHEEPVKSSAAKDAFRKASLPTRSYSVDHDFGTGPKMGGAFARLQAKLEQEPESKAGLYTDVYEAYKIKRSLKEHGVLPANMRSNEQLRKYSFDKEGPPVVMPKPRRDSAEGKRNVFARNRSQTTPTSPTKNFFDDKMENERPVFDENEEQSSNLASMKMDKEASKFDPSVSTEVQLSPSPAPSKTETGSDTDQSSSEPSSVEPENIENTAKLASPFGDRDEIKRLEEAPEVLVMKEEIAQERSKLQEGKQSLSDAIQELEQVDFDFKKTIEGEAFNPKISPSEQKEEIAQIDASNQDMRKEDIAPIISETKAEIPERATESERNVDDIVTGETVKSTESERSIEEISLVGEIQETNEKAASEESDQKVVAEVTDIQVEQQLQPETNEFECNRDKLASENISSTDALAPVQKKSDENENNEDNNSPSINACKKAIPNASVEIPDAPTSSQSHQDQPEDQVNMHSKSDQISIGNQKETNDSVKSTEEKDVTSRVEEASTAAESVGNTSNIPDSSKNGKPESHEQLIQVHTESDTVVTDTERVLKCQSKGSNGLHESEICSVTNAENDERLKGTSEDDTQDQSQSTACEGDATVLHDITEARSTALDVTSELSETSDNQPHNVDVIPSDSNPDPKVTENQTCDVIEPDLEKKELSSETKETIESVQPDTNANTDSNSEHSDRCSELATNLTEKEEKLVTDSTDIS